MTPDRHLGAAWIGKNLILTFFCEFFINLVDIF